MAVLILQADGSQRHIVRTDTYAQPGVQQFFCRVVVIRRLRVALDVARRADFQRHAASDCLLHKRRVVSNMMPMPDAPHAKRERVAHGVGSLRVSCVARRRNAQLARQIEDRMESSQRHNAFRAGKVRTHDAAPQKFLCQSHRLQVFRHIDRLGSDAHRAE